MRFKISKVNNEKYLQIWDNDQFVMSCGSADKLYKKLVRLSVLEGQTKNFDEIKTKILSSVEVEND